MMTRLAVLIPGLIGVLGVALLAGCSRTDATAARVGRPEAVTAVNALILPDRGLDSLPFGTPRETVLARLGLPERNYGGTLLYRSHGFSAAFCSAGLHLRAFSLHYLPHGAEPRFKLQTEGGVSLGSPVAELYTVYGEPEHEAGLLNGFTTLYYDAIQARFGVQDGAVVHMAFSSRHEMCEDAWALSQQAHAQ